MSSTAPARAALKSGPSESLLALALALSLFLHLAALAALHAVPLPVVTSGEREALQVRLVNAAESRPSARAMPPAVRQERQAALARSTVRETPKQRRPVRQARVPRRPMEARAAAPALLPEPPAREVTIAARPLPQAPVAAARPTEPQPAAHAREPSEQALARYGQSVSELLAHARQYPRLARLRGWEGRVTLRLQVAPDGRLFAATLERSSGHELLDRQALDMARSVSRLPPPPQGLRERDFAIVVPVVFELAPRAGTR